MSALIKEMLLPIIISAALIAMGALGAGTWVNARKNAEISQLKQTHAEAETQAASAALKRLQDAQARGDALALQLLNAENARTQLAQEKDREIRRLTTGRRCLDAAVVRVLNNPAQGNQPGAVPQAPGQPAAEDGAAATDTDVAQWARLARDQYDTCRARLGAMIDFEEGK